MAGGLLSDVSSQGHHMKNKAVYICSAVVIFFDVHIDIVSRYVTGMA